MLFGEIAYGPIHSRRLGVSLGMEIMPLEHKLCTFDCVYCECGWNEKVDAELKDAQATGNWERQMQLLKYQPQLLEQRNMICKILGNRVISV